MNVGCRPILIVGAGFAGCVYARSLAEAGLPVWLIDKRAHVAGNAYDEVGSDGILTHRYGPHLFHTANQRVLQWVRRFADWKPYTHRVRAVLPDLRTVPMPINLDTVNAVFDLKLETAEEVERHLARVAIRHENPRNAAEYLESRLGKLLTNLFFRPYTKKMWSLDLEELDAAVVKRIPLRNDRLDTYFAQTETQIMPEGGYTKLVATILDHPLITVELNRSFDHSMLPSALHSFLSMPIDEFFGCSEGELPYRSIRFHNRHCSSEATDRQWAKAPANVAVLNYTDDTPFTRETAWHVLPNHLVRETGLRLYTKEEPCDYRDNDLERYYPINSADKHNEALYKVYASLAGRRNNLTFIGRCGTYRYLNMDQVINQSLMGAESWLKSHAVATV